MAAAAQELDPRVRLQVVVPGGMLRIAALRGDEDDPVPVVEVQERRLPPLAGSRADRLEQPDRRAEVEPDPAVGQRQQPAVDRVRDVDREPGADLRLREALHPTLVPGHLAPLCHDRKATVAPSPFFSERRWTWRFLHLYGGKRANWSRFR